MFYCKDCNRTFDEPNTVDEGSYEEVWGSIVWCQYIVEYCPYCDSDDIREVRQCTEDYIE